MNEARRFFRYLVPGTISFAVLFIFLSFSYSSNFFQLFQLMEKNKEVLKQSGPVMTVIFSFLSFLIISGVMGYLLANLYHYLLWCKWGWFSPTDHAPMLEIANEKQWITFMDTSDTSCIEINLAQRSSPLSKIEAWELVVIIAFQRIESCKKVKGIVSRTENMVDIMHGLGAIFLGIVVVFIFWLLIILVIPHNVANFISPALILYVSVLLLTLYILIKNHQRISKNVQNIVNATILNVLEKESKSQSQEGKPIIYYSFQRPSQ